jgi:hypothetical protein
MTFLAHFAHGDQPSGGFFLPFLEGLAAAMENRMPAALTVDATLWANAMPRAARLVDARGVAVGVLPMIAAESFGVTVMREGADASVVARPDAPVSEPWLVAPMANLLEASRRLAETVRPERELAVFMSGPVTLSQALFGEMPSRNHLGVLKAGLLRCLELICEARPDVVFIDENWAGHSPEATPELRRFHNTLKNVADYYGVGYGLRAAGISDVPAAIASLSGLPVAHLMLGGDPDGTLPDARAAADAAASAGWTSVGLPVAAGSDVEEALAACDSGAIAIYLCGAAQETDIEFLKSVGLRMRQREYPGCDERRDKV